MLQGHLQSRPEHSDRRVAHHDIDLVELLAELGERLRQARRIAHICLHRHGTAPQIPDLLANRLGLLVTIKIDDGHIATRPGQLERRGPSDASRAAATITAAEQQQQRPPTTTE